MTEIRCFACGEIVATGENIVGTRTWFSYCLDCLRNNHNKIIGSHTTYSIKGLAKDHRAQKDFNDFMQKKHLNKSKQ